MHKWFTKVRTWFLYRFMEVYCFILPIGNIKMTHKERAE